MTKFYQFGHLTFGKSKRAAQFNYFIPIQVNMGLKSHALRLASQKWPDLTEATNKQQRNLLIGFGLFENT